MRVLVLDGNQNQAVASVRSLARQGHTVLVGESSSWSKAGWSRYASGTFQYPAPQRGAQPFLEKLTEIVRQEPGTLLLPMTEATTLPVSEQREVLLESGARLVLPAHRDLLRACNKEETTRLACSLGIQVPVTVTITNPDQAAQASKSVTYPVVLKPRSSEELSGKSVKTTGRPRYASNASEFDGAYRDISQRSPVVLVQQFVDGDGAGYFALLNRGELRAEFAHRRIRDVYPTGSGSALRESVKPDPAVREAGLAMLRSLNWHGAAMVEFRHQPGQAPVFMEVNGRMWHSLALACYAGVDFPALLAHMAERDDVEPVLNYREGIRCRWFLGDLRHLVEVWKGAPAGYPRTYPGKLKTLAAEMTPVPGTFHDNFTLGDPLPEVGDWIQFAQKLWNGAGGR
jgi:predicted ATP-grasp superfamily ATP-dependent carboligase